MEKKLLRTDDIRQIFGIGATTMWRWVSNGTLPKPIKVGRLNFWRQSDIDQVLNGVKVKEK